MENPFVLAVALLESRRITTRFLLRTKDSEPDTCVEEERPIDWRLLVYDTTQPKVAEGNALNPTVAACDSDQ